MIKKRKEEVNKQTWIVHEREVTAYRPWRNAIEQKLQVKTIVPRFSMDARCSRCGLFITGRLFHVTSERPARTFSPAPGRPGLDDCRHCLRSHRLPGGLVRPQVPENG